jgi:hypothetical protein
MNRVELAPRARAQVRVIDEWWRENRPAAPALFADELANALEQMAGSILFATSLPKGYAAFFVVIDLKAVAFRPEFAGKMSFYRSAVSREREETAAEPMLVSLP